MKPLFRATLISLVSGAFALQANPVVDLRLILTDPKTAGSLEKALQEGSMIPSQVEDRLDAMAKGNTLTVLSHFKQQFSPQGQRLHFDKDREDVRIADGEVMPCGIELEAEPHVGPSGLIDIRFFLDRSVPKARNRIETARTNTAGTIKSDRWDILCDWGDEKQATLLLARVTGMTPTKEPAAHRLFDVGMDAEIRWCESSDLKTFERSTPATYSKAVAWLMRRSKLIATSGIRMRSGQRSSQQDILQWIHDDNGWETSELGWTLDFLTTVGPNGKLIDLQLKSQWQPKDARRPSSKPQFTFNFAETTESGTTLVIEPKTRPDSGPVPVIFITPTIRMMADAKKSTDQLKLPEEGKIGGVFYPVHPSMMRRFAEITEPNANPRQGVIAQRPLMEMLQAMGMKFPAGTSATFDSSQCQVMLFNDRQGHQMFRAILHKYELSMPQEGKDPS